MTLIEFLKSFHDPDSNVENIKIIGVTNKVKKILSNESSFTSPIYSIYENNKLCNCHVIEAWIEQETNMIVKLC